MMTHKTAPKFRCACMKTSFFFFFLFFFSDPPWFPVLWQPLAGQLEMREIHSVEQASRRSPGSLAGSLAHTSPPAGGGVQRTDREVTGRNQTCFLAEKRKPVSALYKQESWGRLPLAGVRRPFLHLQVNGFRGLKSSLPLLACGA